MRIVLLFFCLGLWTVIAQDPKIKTDSKVIQMHEFEYAIHLDSLIQKELFSKNFEKFSTQTPFLSSHSLDGILEFNSKLSKIALETIKKNTELSQEWSKETLNSLETFTKTQKNPSDYSKVINDFVTQQTQSSPKHIAEFAEIAKKAQLDTCLLYTSDAADE